MQTTLYKEMDFSLFTENENLNFACRKDSDTVLHMEIRAAQDFTADRMSVTLSLSSSDYAGIAGQFHFIPGIKQRKENICGAHVFRSPAAILSDGECSIALIPDMPALDKKLAELTFLDMRFDEQDSCPPYLELGLIHQKSEPHMYYVPTGENLTVEKGTVLPFYILCFRQKTAYQVLHEVQTFLFETFAKPYEQYSLPQTVSFDTYARYGNAFGESMYQEYENGGGIPLTTFLKENGTYSGREYADDQFFHCWFNNMRTARELYYFGKRLSNEKWVHMARQIRNLLLTAPQQDGLFPTIYAPHDGGWIGSSLQGGGPEYYSLPDCAWTAYQLMLYGETCEPSKESDAFLKNFADGLLKQVRPDGTFPVWVKIKENSGVERNGVKDEPGVATVTERLLGTTASVLCAHFLAEYALRHGGEEYKNAAIGYMEYIAENCLLQQKFEDFELYYSCSAKKEDYYDKISRMWGQNTLAMQWTAESYLALYKLTGEEKYLTYGKFALDLMTMYQQVWNPPYVSIYAFGGFGVMNTDAEWNDARQAQFAETLANFYDVTGEKLYFKRAVAALRASFMLMVIDENAAVSPKTVIPRQWLNEAHGGMAENYGHDGIDERSGQSGFHWGSGSALVTAAEFMRRYGDVVEFTPICELKVEN